MATLSLTRAKTAPSCPANTTAEFRFENTPMGTLTFPNANQWKNFSPNSKNFSSSGKLKLFMGGMLVSTCPTKIHPTPQQTGNQRTLSCVLGPFTVEYNVVP